MEDLVQGAKAPTRAHASSSIVGQTVRRSTFVCVHHVESTEHVERMVMDLSATVIVVGMVASVNSATLVCQTRVTKTQHVNELRTILSASARLIDLDGFASFWLIRAKAVRVKMEQRVKKMLVNQAIFPVSARGCTWAKDARKDILVSRSPARTTEHVYLMVKCSDVNVLPDTMEACANSMTLAYQLRARVNQNASGLRTALTANVN